MAPVQLKYVVSFSSQDAKYPVDNLLNPDVSKRWLGAPGEKSGRLEAEFQMEKASTISHLDIGTHFVFSVEILVGRSSWPMGKEFVTLLPSSTFMSPSDCRTGKNKTVVRMFKKEDFDASAVREKWDRIRILCAQPFRKDVQFGLSLFKVVSEDEAAATVMSDAIADKICSGTPPSVRKQSKTLGLSPSLSASLSKALVSPFSRTTSEAAEKSIAMLSPNGRYSRAGQLLIAAAERTVQYKQPSTSFPTKSSEKPLPKETDFDSRQAKKKKTIDEEISDFIDPIDFAKINVETVTFADLRHQFEKQKKRKLSKEEKQCFINSTLRAVEKYALSLDDDIVIKEDTNGGSSKSLFNKKFNQSEGMLTNGNADKDRGNDPFGGRQSTSAKMLDVEKISNTMQTSKHNGQKNNCQPPNSSNSSGGKLGQKKIPSKRKLILTEEEKQSIAPNSKIPKRNLPSLPSEKTDSAKSTNNVWLSKSPPTDQDIRSQFKKKQSKPSATITSADLNSLDSTDVLVLNDDDDEDLPCMLEPTVTSLVRDSDVECPLCMKRFPSDLIEAHASGCSL